MSRLRIILCASIIFSVAISSGCRGVGAAIKGMFGGAGKTISNTARRVNNVMDVADVAEVALDVTSGNNTSGGNNPGGTRPNVNRTSSKAGAVIGGAAMAGGALITNELLSGALDSRDLSLGTLAIDDNADKVNAELGRPSEVKTDSDGAKRMIFKDMEVVVHQGKISALVSNSSTFATPRGIHEGSTLQEVFDKYGTNYSKTVYDSQTLYEYKITSADGHPCWLRFAVNNSDNKVAYISERFVQSEPQSGGASDSGISPEETFRNYHRAITNGNYRAAYEMLSYAQRDKMGSLDSYTAGFRDTISSEVTDLKLVSSDGDVCTFNYTLTARDRYQGNRVKVQTFKGQVTLAKDKGRWYIRSAQSNKVNERYE